VNEYVNNIYGLIITLGFITIITIGFVFELGKGALKYLQNSIHIQ